MTEFLVLGIDGLDYSIIKNYAEEWQLRNLLYLKENTFKLKVPLPSMTGCVWPAIYTGCNPAKTGAIAFRDVFVNENYESKILTYEIISKRAKGFFELLKEEGLTTALFNLPLMFKPVLSDFCVSHFYSFEELSNQNALDLFLKFNFNDNVFPPMYFDLKKEYEKLKFSFFAISEILKRNYDFVFAVVMELDHIQHKYQKYFFKKHPLYNQRYQKTISAQNFRGVFEFFYKEIDHFIGEVLEKTKNVIIISDHGTSPTFDFFNINKFLAKNGYLKLTSQFKIDYKNSKCFSPSIFVNINKKGVYPYGMVKESEVAVLKKELIEKFNSLKHPVLSVRVCEAIDSASLYSGPLLKYLPDILFKQPENSFTAMVATVGENLKNFHQFFLADYDTGVHNYGVDGTFIVYGDDVKENLSSFSIQPSAYDIAPTLLNFFEKPIEKNMDGKALPVFKKEKKVLYKNYYIPDYFEKKEKAKDEIDKKLLKHLEDLGYII